MLPGEAELVSEWTGLSERAISVKRFERSNDWILRYIKHTFYIAALGMGLCVAFIALVRLPSLKVSTLLLVGLLVYDVFWVRTFTSVIVLTVP